jgi:hypothetical protein
MRCLVCGQEFVSWGEFDGHYWDYNERGGGTLDIIHQEAISNYKEGSPCVLCGGKVKTFGYPPDGWETVCLQCGLLYDED